MRRSAGTGWSAGSRWGPFHSTSAGGRPRNPSPARSNALPLLNAARNAPWCRRWAQAPVILSQVCDDTPTMASGGPGIASSSEGSDAPSVPRPVTTSVTSVSSEATGVVPGYSVAIASSTSRRAARRAGRMAAKMPASAASTMITTSCTTGSLNCNSPGSSAVIA